MLGTLTHRASSDAEGIFEVAVDTTHEAGPELFDNNTILYAHAAYDPGALHESSPDRSR